MSTEGVDKTIAKTKSTEWEYFSFNKLSNVFLCREKGERKYKLVSFVT